MTLDGTFIVDEEGPWVGRYSYDEVQAISRSGRVRGAWEQVYREPFMYGHRGHGNLFRTFERKDMLVVMNRSAQGGLGNGTRSEYYDVEITDEGVKVLKHRQDLDGQLGLSLEDKTPPDLYLPLNQVVDATSPAGAPVSYTAMAHDWRQGPVPLKTSHDSGFTSLSAALGRLKFPFGNRENFDGVGPGVLRRAESGKALSISLTNKLLANAERIAAVIGS